MTTSREFSDEHLNAFIDGELAPGEREDILAAISCDAQLGRRLCELRATKDMVRHAYDDSLVPMHPRGGRPPVYGWALVAGLTLMVGIGLGWQAHSATAEGGTALALVRNLFASEPGRILIHLDSATEERMEETLDMAEAYLAKAGRARVEVVVNNSGLDLLREQATPYTLRIADMSARYDMLAFVACGTAIARYRANGRDVTLLPEARVAKTAVEHIVDRVQQGWTYVKI